MSTPPRSAIAESMARLGVQAARILDSLAKQLTQVRLASYQASSLTARRNASRYLADVARIERHKAVSHLYQEAHRVRRELGLPSHVFVPGALGDKGQCWHGATHDNPAAQCGMVKGAHPA